MTKIPQWLGAQKEEKSLWDGLIHDDYHILRTTVGISSCKLMRSVMCGSPVIASSFDSLRFVSREGIRVQVRHPSEIPAANMGNERPYREKCLDVAPLN